MTLCRCASGHPRLLSLDSPQGLLNLCKTQNTSPLPELPRRRGQLQPEAGRTDLTPKAISRLFGYPFMDGMERKGMIADGTPEEIRRATQSILAEAPEERCLTNLPGPCQQDDWELFRSFCHEKFECASNIHVISPCKCRL